MARTVIGDATSAGGLNIHGSIQVAGVEVVDATGVIKADIKDNLAQGSIYIGDASGITSELSIKANAKILVGNGTTAVAQSVTGDITMTNGGVVTIQDSIVKVATLTINSAAIKGLAATPAEVVASPGAGRGIILEEATIKLIPNAGDAFVENVGGSNLAFKLGDATGVQVSEDIEMTGFVTQATNYVTNTIAKKDVIGAQTAYENRSLVIHNIGAGEITGDAAGTGEFRVTVRYRIIQL